jgi:hypothetical protein
MQSVPVTALFYGFVFSATLNDVLVYSCSSYTPTEKEGSRSFLLRLTEKSIKNASGSCNRSFLWVCLLRHPNGK